MKKHYTIPSAEDFKRAKAADRARNRGLSEASEIILKQFDKQGVHECFMFYSPANNSFGAYIFYRWNFQIDAAEKFGLSSRIKEAVYSALEQVDRGDRNSINLNIEFDSHENVEKNYEGDYFLRLR